MTGDPLKAIEDMQGKVWEKMIEKAELPIYQEKHNVIFSRLLGGKTIIHVANDSQPETSFKPVIPDLEDVYFSAIKMDNVLKAV